MKSILAPDKQAELIEKIDVEVLIKLYPDVDISRFVSGLTHISKMRCTYTDYTWYAPAQLCGDGKFYEDLYGQATDDYYPKWRWAWQEAMKEISKSDKVLEIGSGGLQFMKNLKDNGIEACGLEINPMSISLAKKLDLNLHAATIEEFAKNEKEKFDVVVFFEVLEHVYDVNTFLQAAISALKPGGKMIFSVPNNTSFIKDEVLKLNMPPHHVGLWAPKAIENITKVFPVAFKYHAYEPLLEGHLNWYLTVIERQDVMKMNKVFRSLYFRLGVRNWRLKSLSKKRDQLIGQTILSVFEKK
jgi:2-polyprenyl-3-methyl-5-hydroxy-6-metoxy-1,4-benzoquinol methylase